MCLLHLHVCDYTAKQVVVVGGLGSSCACMIGQGHANGWPRPCTRLAEVMRTVYCLYAYTAY